MSQLILRNFRPLAQSIFGIFSRPPQSRKPRRRKVVPTAIAAEVLEQRTLMTVVVTPEFGPMPAVWNVADTTVPGQIGNTAIPIGDHNVYALNGPMALGTNLYSLKSPVIELVFWGTDWTTTSTSTTPIAAVSNAISEIKTMLSPQNGFLRTVAEYGSDGKASFGGAWIDNTAENPTAGGNTATNELAAVLQNQRSKNLLSVSGAGALPLPASTDSSVDSPRIYVIIRNTTNAATKDTFGATNYLAKIPTTDPNTNQTVTVNVNAIQTEVGNNADSICEIISHELQERMIGGDLNGGDAIVFLPTTLQSTWLVQEGVQIQVCDGEPDGGGGYYAFPLNGPGSPTLQAAWSVTRQAYVMSDADTVHDYLLTPNWNVHSGIYTNANGISVNGATTDSNFKYDLALTVNSGESLSIGYDKSTSTDVFTWGNGQKQAFSKFDLGAVNITLAGSSNHSITLGDLTGISSVTITPTGPAAVSDHVQIVPLPGLGIAQTVSLFQKTSFTAVVNPSYAPNAASDIQYLAIDVSSPTRDLVVLQDGGWLAVLPEVQSFAPGYQRSQTGLQTLLALTQDGVLHKAYYATAWNTLQTGVTKFDFGVLPQIQQGSQTNYNMLLTLDYTGKMSPYVNGYPMTPLNGIKDLEISRWNGRPTAFYLKNDGSSAAYFGPTNNPYNSASKNLTVDTSILWNGFQSTAVLNGTAGDFLLGLNADGTLLRSDGISGWKTAETQIRASKVAAWAGQQYGFTLDASGTLKTSVDGLNWIGQGSVYTAFDVGSFMGTNVLFALKDSGDLVSSTGSGWGPVASGVKSFRMGMWHGVEYAFYLDNAGNLHASSNGIGFFVVSAGVQSFAVGSMSAVDTLYMLTVDGRLLSAASTSPIPSAASPAMLLGADVQSIELAWFNRRNTLFALDGHGVLQSVSSVDGHTLVSRATGVISFGVGLFSTVPYVANPTLVVPLRGTTTDYLFALHGDGTLQRTTNFLWDNVTTNVASLQVARWVNTNYVFYQTSGNGLYSSLDGVHFANQGNDVQSFSVIQLAGADTLVALTTTGVLQASTGHHWTPVAIGIQSFATGFFGTINRIFYLTWGLNLYESPDGSTSFLIQGSVESFGFTNLGGMGTILALTSGGTVRSSVNNGTWYTLSFSVGGTGFRSLSVGWWNGENTFMVVDNSGTVNVWGDSTANALAYGPAQSAAFATLNGEHWILSLDSNATLSRNDGSGWNIVTHGVISFDVAHWASRNYAFYLDSSHILATSSDGINWTPQDSGVTKFAVGVQAGQTYLYDLNQAGDLKQSIGGGWKPIDSGVNECEMNHWASANYIFYVTTKNILKTSPDGRIWTPQASNAQTFVVQTLTSRDTLFVLTTDGVLQRSTGSGWIRVVSGVRTLFGRHFAGLNTVFYTDGLGELYSTTNGVKWNDQGGAYSTVLLSTMQGTDLLFALTTTGDLLRSSGTGWIKVAGNVKQLFQTRSSGVPIIEYVTFSHTSFSTTNGYYWTPV